MNNDQRFNLVSGILADVNKLDRELETLTNGLITTLRILANHDPEKALDLANTFLPEQRQLIEYLTGETLEPKLTPSPADSDSPF